MRLDQIAAMTYTVRDSFQSEAGIREAFGRIADIGYKAVELFGLEEIAPERVASMLGDAGLTAVACHINPSALLSDPQAAAERVRAMGCKFAIFPIPRDVELDNHDEVIQFARRLNSCGRTLAKSGVGLAYHNHQLEFRRAGGFPALKVIFENTDPEFVKAELDTYWAQYGGGNPATWCEKLSGRMPLLHIKDYAINEQGQPVFAEAGRGNLDWEVILDAAKQAGCEWYIVEQDVCPGDPFASLKISFEFLQTFVKSGSS